MAIFNSYVSSPEGKSKKWGPGFPISVCSACGAESRWTTAASFGAAGLGVGSEAAPRRWNNLVRPGIGFHGLPSGYVKIAIENGDLVRGFSHWKWWFSIVFLYVYQRVSSTYGYESIPINSIFRGMNIHKSQLFWCELQGYKVLTHCHI